jgi:hypothetical protein
MFDVLLDVSQASVVNRTLLQVKTHGLEFIQEAGNSGGLGREWEKEFIENIVEYKTPQIHSECRNKLYWKEDYQ